MRGIKWLFVEAMMLFPLAALQHGAQHKICGQRAAVIALHRDEGRRFPEMCGR
jgi:hypothetical protein